MMTLPSKSFLLAAVLAVAARVPTSLGGEAAIPPSQAANPILLSPGVEFLASNPPSVVLASTFPTSELHALFETWKESFPRAYATVREAASRKLVWLDNHARIEGHNGRIPPARYSLGHNDFSDLTNDEFKQRFYLGEHSPGVMMPEGRDDGLGLGSSASSRNLLRNEEDGGEEGSTDAGEAAMADVPEHKNWDEEGAVTSVKNQWFCGACWAFSAIGAIEGARFIETGNLTELSVQQLIDCDKADLGCGGGLMSMAFQYDEDSVGLCAHEDYPFAYHRHWFWGCKRYMPYCDPLPLTKVQSYVNVTGTEVGLRAAIATQPVSVAVSAGHVDWQFYRKGVFDDGCTEKIDHGVLAVGFGTDPDAGDYWLIKNSWGARWGLDGYIRLSRGVGHEAEGGSSCVLSMASRPIMKEED